MAQNAQQELHTAAHQHDRSSIVSGRRLSGLIVAAVVILAGVVPAAMQAQDAGNGFLFKEPIGSFAVRGGFSRPTAGGDLFSFVTDQLTLSQRNFSGPTVGADLAVRVAPRLDIVLGTSYAGTSSSSEFRHLVDQNNAAITQTTSFQRIPVTASVRAYLTPRGRSVGRFAWVPARFAPYVGAGGGAVWYRFRQQGDFVDYQTNNVFPGDFTSSQWTPAGQAMAGIDYSLSPRLALTGEAKYIWAKGTLNNSFTNFNSIDLSGLSTTIGLYVRF